MPFSRGKAACGANGVLGEGEPGGQAVHSAGPLLGTTRATTATTGREKASLAQLVVNWGGRCHGK